MPRKPSPLTPDIVWDERAGRYASASTGRYIASRLVKDELEKVIIRSGENIAAASEALRAGSIGLAEWQTTMMREVKLAHVASAAAANGGWAQMSQSDWGFTGNLIKKQYQWLDRFAGQIASGEQPLDGRMMVRAKMYAEAGRGTYEQTRHRYQANNNGMTEERRVRTADESCPGCLEQAKLGWQPFGTLDPIGAEECKTHCKCHFEYRRLEGDGSYTYAEG